MGCTKCDGGNQKSALLYGSKSTRSLMLYDCYTNTEDNWDIYTNGGCGIRDTQYKLLHHYSDNITDGYMSQYDVLDDDSDISTINNCVIPSTGKFEVN